MRRQEVKIIVYAPQTAAGRMELAQRAAAVHADAVLQHVGRLPCPYESERCSPQCSKLCKAHENSAGGAFLRRCFLF